jgi:alpha-galactosidase
MLQAQLPVGRTPDLKADWRRLCLLTVLLMCRSVKGLDNGLGKTPPMNWSPWNHFTIHASEEMILDNARALVSTGLHSVGYNLVQLDAGSLVARDATGRLVPNATLFPNGLKNLSQQLHGMGLQFGVYTDISGHSCSFNPNIGSMGHYDLDAKTFAEWGADYVKVDYCGYCRKAPCADARDLSIEPEVQYAAFAAFRDALNKTGRPMYYSICPHRESNGRGTEAAFSMLYVPPGSWSEQEQHALANSLLVEYSNTPDQWVGGIAGGIVANIDAMVTANELSYSGASSWNDADMLQACNYGQGRTPGDGMLLNEYRAHYAVWAILASPLILGADLRNLKQTHPACLELLLNPEIVAVNQDVAALPPRLIWQHPPTGTRNITSASITAQAFARPLSRERLAVLLLNRGPSPANMSVAWEQLGLPSGSRMVVYDVIGQKYAGTAVGAFTAAVPSHDVSFVVLSAP